MNFNELMQHFFMIDGSLCVYDSNQKTIFHEKLINFTYFLMKHLFCSMAKHNSIEIQDIFRKKKSFEASKEFFLRKSFGERVLINKSRISS